LPDEERLSDAQKLGRWARRKFIGDEREDLDLPGLVRIGVPVRA
jgi:hypothetical protein